jgi:hypothetical protein
MAKTSSFGVQFKQGSNVIANLISLGEFALGTKEFIDCTTHDSADRFREYLGTLIDSASITGEIAWDPAESTHAALAAARATFVNETWSAIFPTDPAVTWSFTGQLETFTIGETPIDGKHTASFSIKRTAGGFTES